ncbi:MAG: hypothetical protein OXG78_03850 [Chloroflexi bacterium]|nr:hypothetical protein [Chloroflexota bacterium]
MDDKRKPYATIMIRKPRISLLLSAILIAAIVAVAAGGILQERADRAVELEILQNNLETTQYTLMRSETERGIVEDQLRAAESQLEEYHRHFAEPAGYYDYSDGRGKWLRLFSCSHVVLDSFAAGEGATLVAYNVIDRKAVSALTRRDNYALAGEFLWTPEEEAAVIIYFYLRQDVLEDADFTWPEREDWATVHRNWEDYLDDFCHQL